MKIATSELTGPGLAWAVAMVEGWEPFVQFYNQMKDGKVVGKVYYMTCRRRQFNTVDWASCGPIIERCDITTMKTPRGWAARANEGSAADTMWVHGSTPLIAAMRCYVASKLGDEVDVPEELLV